MNLKHLIGSKIVMLHKSILSLDQSKKVAEQNGHARYKLVILESTKSFNVNSAISELYKTLLWNNLPITFANIIAIKQSR